MSIVAGVDFGTASVRVSIVDSVLGRLGSGSAPYPVLRDANDPNFATQRHADHVRALELAFESALRSAAVDGKTIEALAIDTTGSTVVPVDEHLTPLSDYYLWCDHRAWREAAEITARGHERPLEALGLCGGTYSSEWGLAKVLHWLRNNPDFRTRFHTALEHCDYITATLCGIRELADLPRSICAMGHKWMWNRELGGLPPEDFLESIDPLLGGLRERLQGLYRASDQIAGRLSDEWAWRLGLKSGIPIATGALDAHWDAIGAGCRRGDIVNVIGTSSCVMALADGLRVIPGISGAVRSSIHPEYVGLEAGLSAVGDIFDAIARRASTTVDVLSQAVQGYRAAQTGLLRLCWDNGDRCILGDPNLRGITVGWRLNHTAADELFAAIEGTALQTRIILERMQEYGVSIERVIHAGGIPRRNETLNRVYANVLGKPVLVPVTDMTSMGSAIFAFLAAGTFQSVEDAQAALCPSLRVIEPVTEEAAVYDELFVRFRELYFTLSNSSLTRLPRVY